jgi:translation initiation factor IF-2
LELPRAITVGELAQRVGANPVEVIKNLMRMGVMASLNQAIDLEVASPIAQYYGFQVKEGSGREGPSLGERMGAGTQGVQQPRPPVVTVLGHVDHGKTSILDAIRKSNVAAGEAGGITQHIGAYQVDVNGQKVTFLDTPGHEAFTTLRARGAHVTDIAVLVVAADDGVMPQTIEAISHAKAAGVPIVVAINKMDLPGADPERIKRQLSEHGLLVEDWGGDVISVPVSAKTREGLDDLLESVLLVAEVAELKADPTVPARGTIVEAQLHPNRGPVATVLVQSGSLKPGATVVVGSTWGRIRAMTDYAGHRVKEAGPSAPVEILGLADVPRAGDVLEQVENEKAARDIVQERQRTDELIERRQPSSLEQLANQIGAGEVKDLNVIVKADVHGSLEAIRSSLERLSDESARVNLLHTDVGSITEGDVLLASASGATILGFNTRVETAARRLADNQGIEIRNYAIIYQLLDDVENALRGIAAPLLHEVQEGKAEVRQVFELRRTKVAGCVVADGRIRRGALSRVRRGNQVVFEGPIASLRHFRDEAREVVAGQECGIAYDGFSDFKEGDVIETYRQEERPAR